MARLNARLPKTLWCPCSSQTRLPEFDSQEIKINTSIYKMLTVRETPHISAHGSRQVNGKGGSAALFALFDKKRARGSLCTIVGGVAKLLWMQPLRGGQSYGLGATPLDATGGV
jgi:hypothetical protein